MKIDWKKLIICLVVPLAVGGLSALLSGSMQEYAYLERPPLSPPGWVFPIVWTLLYLMMGYASYLVITSDKDTQTVRKAMNLYGAQLVLNFLWSIIFFGLEWRLVAFFVLIGLWILVYLTFRAFSGINEQAGDLILPYLLWVTFAGYLNFGVYFLNRN